MRSAPQDQQGKPIWVSGSAGALGGAVVDQLRQRGVPVVGADSAAEAEHRVELTDPAAVRASLQGCSAVIHCAAMPSPENVAPATLVSNNTMSTFNVLEEAWRAGIRTAVLASSGAIYGSAWSPEPLPAPFVPVTEERPLEYVDPYALTKDFLERMGQMYARRGMVVTALRFHWILSIEQLRRLDGRTAEADDARSLWGYVELGDAARACVDALHPDVADGRYHVLSITAADNRGQRPIEDLLADHAPQTEQRTPLRGRQGAWDCSRARAVIGWEPRSRWR